MRYSKLPLASFLISIIVFSCSNSESTDNKDEPKESQAIEVNLTNVISPFQDEKIPLQNVSISTEKDTVLVFNSGSFIDIPENAFLDENGNLVKGKVDFSFREFANPIDFFASGIPMTLGSDENGVDFLKSAGMVEITASQNGNALKPNPDSQINIGIASNKEDEYPLYEFEEGKGWKTDRETELYNQEKIDSIAKSTIPELPRVRKMDYTLYSVTEALVGDKPNLAKFEGMNFQAVDKKNNRPIPSFLKDMDIKPIGNGRYKFIITEHAYNKEPYEVICSRVYDKQEFEKKAKAYYEKYGEYIRLRDAILRSQAKMKSQGNNVLRSFGLKNFGILNCDQPDRIEYAKYTYSVNGEARPNIVLYCIDYTRNAKYSCTKIDKIAVEGKNEFAIFGINDKKEVLYSPVSECKKALKGNHFNFKLKELNSHKSIEELADLLNN